MLCVQDLFVCLSSNASFQTNSDTAASIGLLLCFWQVGGAIANSQGTVVIKGSEFVGNTATVNDAVYTSPFCVLIFKCFISN
jgi:hypothetical protein